MRVFVSEQFLSCDPEGVRKRLIDEFKKFKEAPGREYEFLIFGKDSGFEKPRVGNGGYALRHCHLIPLNDEVALKRWVRDYRHRSRKTSDRVLIYAQDGNDYFLLDVVDDPGAHEVMRMADRVGRAFMMKCAKEAEAFLDGQLELQPA